jgi:hypothetical protein
MNPHPYLRAYMAGVAVPSVFLLFVLAAFCVVRFDYNPALPVERALVFPLALVPALWGGWNMIYLAVREHAGRWYSLGVHGAVVPLVLLPVAVLGLRGLGFEFAVDVARVVVIAAPPLMIIYYLVWKYLVGFLNEALGVA